MRRERERERNEERGEREGEVRMGRVGRVREGV